MEMNDMYEIFMDIKGYEGKYQVSNLGNVRNSKGKVMKQNKDKDGYMIITLHKDGKTKTHKVHRLVLSSFKANPDNKPQVNHKDENKENNNLNNLEWCTSKENVNYGTRNERVAEKFSKPVYCITNNTIYKSSCEAARQLNLNQSSITKCLKGKFTQTKGYQFKYYKGE